MSKNSTNLKYLQKWQEQKNSTDSIYSQIGKQNLSQHGLEQNDPAVNHAIDSLYMNCLQ